MRSLTSTTSHRHKAESYLPGHSFHNRSLHDDTFFRVGRGKSVPEMGVRFVSGGNRIDCVKCQVNTKNGQRQVSLFWVSTGRGRWWKVVTNGVEQSVIQVHLTLYSREYN